MDITMGFLIYTTLFHLVVIAVGAIGIILGYRLFSNAIEQSKATAIAEAGGWKITLRNFTPGIYFACFGTVIIGIMLWKGIPELTLRGLADAEHSPTQGEIIDILNMRGDDDKNINDYWKALLDPNLTLQQAAEPISHIARIWRTQGRSHEALAMAQLAATVKRDNSAYLGLFAQLLIDNDQRDKARQVLEDAVKLDARYQEPLSKLQE